MATSPRRGPISTLRLQLRREFAFADVLRLVGYFESLGVDRLYLSPVFKARPGSPHGYDVLDHSEISAELGGEDGLRALSDEVHSRGMGLVLDLVPNHMCVASADNRWWNDVLENGPSSPFARYFDVDWSPPKEDLHDKVLLPVLGDQYGRVLEKGEIRVEREGGTFLARYYEQSFPLAPKSWTLILEPARLALESSLAEDDPDRVEFESILTAISHLPSRSERDPERVQERQREKEVVKRRLGALLEGSATVVGIVDGSLAELNGRLGDPRSFDRLEALLADQGYRLSHWRVATDEINYRRFFDINELAALRVEEAEVFEALHSLPLRLAREGIVDGFRIDHVDGLLDPAAYLAQLPRDLYVVVEKILVGAERLRPDWAGQGTTGYDYLNAAGALLVEPHGWPSLMHAYAAFTGQHERFSDVVYESKKLVLEVSLSSELTVLARRLDRISEQHRYSRDFTLNSQQEALAEVVACFPVYRSYVTGEGDQVSPEDRRLIQAALRLARRRNPAVSGSLFDFLGTVLLLEHPEGLTEADREERRDFVRRLQQLAGPVMAKGLEDTASYRFYPLAALNEVGGEAEPRGDAVSRFHAQNGERLRLRPGSMTATSTHDTKRDEDTRARISVLSEVPAAWEAALFRWHEMNRPFKTVEDEVEVPSPAEEHLLYQTLVGVWPSDRDEAGPTPELVSRVQTYMQKALREAKANTSWVSPNEPYESAVAEFLARTLRPEHLFLSDFLTFLRPLVRPGLLNAAAQVVLKVAAPGVPDFFQGTELPEYRLVDPDNRGLVDFDRRARALRELQSEAASDAPGLSNRLLRGRDGRLKLYVTHAALHQRRRRPDLFLRGDYVALGTRGTEGDDVVAFARVHEGAAVIAAAGRFFTRRPWPPVGSAAWGDAALVPPPGSPARWRELLTGRLVVPADSRTSELPLADVFGHLPMALLESAP